MSGINKNEETTLLEIFAPNADGTSGEGYTENDCTDMTGGDEGDKTDNINQNDETGLEDEDITFNDDEKIDLQEVTSENDNNDEDNDCESYLTLLTPEMNAQATTSTLKPVFMYAGSEDEIKDLETTFEDLRKNYAKMFPELEKKDKVSWVVEYGYTNTFIEADKTIGEVKAEMEREKKFIDAIKKTKKPVKMIVKPKVTGQTKGTYGFIIHSPSFVGSDKLELIKRNFVFHNDILEILNKLHSNGSCNCGSLKNANLVRLMLEYAEINTNVSEIKKGA